jgi:hypothetical protein
MNLLLSIYYQARAEGTEENGNCVVKPIETLKLPASSGTLVYSLAKVSPPQFQSLPTGRAPQIDLDTTGKISPNGLYNQWCKS